ncbi:unnamed protein product [Cunninghamella blakesleeana]
MGDKRKSTTLQKLTQWSAAVSPNSSMPSWTENRKFNVNNNVDTHSFQFIDHDDLIQGSLYILKVKIVTIGLFEGWNDDMCCFSVLRSDTGSMRWSEARYLPGDFDAYDAFDEAGNPPVYFWTRFLRIQVPFNWFSLFEEARRRQRAWTVDLQQHYIYENEDQDLTAFPVPPSPEPSISPYQPSIHNKASIHTTTSTHHEKNHIYNNNNNNNNNNEDDDNNTHTQFTQLRYNDSTNNKLDYHPLPPPPIPPYLSSSKTEQINEIISPSQAPIPPKKSSTYHSSLHHQQHEVSAMIPSSEHIVYSPTPSFKHTQRKQLSPLPLRPSSPPSISSFNIMDHQSMERRLSSNTVHSRSMVHHDNNNNNNHNNSSNNNINRSTSEKSIQSKRKSLIGIF